MKYAERVLSYASFSLHNTRDTSIYTNNVVTTPIVDLMT